MAGLPIGHWDELFSQLTLFPGLYHKNHK